MILALKTRCPHCGNGYTRKEYVKELVQGIPYDESDTEIDLSYVDEAIV